MTQAFNLGQLANKVNTSGQLDASTGLTNTAAVANGGTGRATLTAGTVLLGNGTSQVTMLAGTTTNDALIWSGTAWASSPVASAGGGGGYQMTVATSPSSYTKPASLKAIKVTVVGSGGTGGAQTGSPISNNVSGGGGAGGASIYYALAPALPASAIPISAGVGTNSFGAIASATAGGTGGSSANAPGSASAGGGSGGTGSGGTINFVGGRGDNGLQIGPSVKSIGNGGNSIFGSGGSGASGGYGSGGTGGSGAGAPGVVIIEEFF